MDFMKVFDQTVREIKREVNLKVLKVPEIEQKVLDATDDEPWGPHGTVLAEIARATNKFSECQMVMNVLWTRLTETGKNWRFVYKSLAVIEYLVAHGSERAVDDIVEHTFQISSLGSFEYVEPSGKDLGINVRKKAETIVALLNDKEKIQGIRNKAAENRDKYVGLSSTGISYKSGAASFGSGSSSQSSGRYGGFGGEKYGDSFRDSNKDRGRYDEDKFDQKSRRESTNSPSNASRKGSSRSKIQETRSADASKTTRKTDEPEKYASTQSSTAPSNKYDDDFDDFDPRGTSSAKPSSGTSHKVDLFGQDLIGDLLDAPIPVPTDNSVTKNNSSEVDLFVDAAFVSATSPKETGVNVDLFASQPAPSSAVPTVDFFAASDSSGQSDNKSKNTSNAFDPFAAPDPSGQSDNKSENVGNTTSNAFDPFAAQVPSGQSDNKSKNIDNTTSNAFDPFAAIPLNSFDSADPFGTVSPNSANNTTPAGFNEAGTDSKPSSQSNLNGSPFDIKTQQKKDPFQVKSGIWSDSLSRGLIDLNISAPKKVNLADVGVVGGLTDGFDEEKKGSSTSFHMGRAMGAGTGLGKSGFHSPASDDDFFSSLSSSSSQQYQFGGLQK